MDSETKYSITGNTVIRNKATGKTITINNPNRRPINIYFNETTSMFVLFIIIIIIIIIIVIFIIIIIFVIVFF